MTDRLLLLLSAAVQIWIVIQADTLSIIAVQT